MCMDQIFKNIVYKKRLIGQRKPYHGESQAGPGWLRGDPTAVWKCQEGKVVDPNSPVKWQVVIRQGTLAAALELQAGHWEKLFH